MKTHDIEAILWEEYFRLEQQKAILWLLAQEAFRDYVRTQEDSAWNAYRTVMDRHHEIREKLDTARAEWSLACKSLHDFPLSGEEQDMLAQDSM